MLSSLSARSARAAVLNGTGHRSLSSPLFAIVVKVSATTTAAGASMRIQYFSSESKSPFNETNYDKFTIPFRPRERSLDLKDESSSLAMPFQRRSRGGKKKTPPNPMKFKPPRLISNMEVIRALERRVGRKAAEQFKSVQKTNPVLFEDLRLELSSHVPYIRAAEGLRAFQRRSELNLNLEQQIDEGLRDADFMLSEPGSYEDRVGHRRARSLFETEEDLEDWEDQFETIEEDAEMELLRTDWQDQTKRGTRKRINLFGNHDVDFDAERVQKIIEKTAEEELAEETEAAMFYKSYTDFTDDDERDSQGEYDPNAKVYGTWSEYLVCAGRNIKLWRGGRLESYRTVVVGGNMNGCAGIGFGKGIDAQRALIDGALKTKKNVFYIDRYNNNGLTADLAGKHNSCKVIIRRTEHGLTGNDLVREICKLFGIANASCKTFENRNPYNVVLATFKAIMTHRAFEDTAIMRGRRLVPFDRMIRMGL